MGRIPPVIIKSVDSPTTSEATSAGRIPPVIIKGGIINAKITRVIISSSGRMTVNHEAGDCTIELAGDCTIRIEGMDET